MCIRDSYTGKYLLWPGTAAFWQRSKRSPHKSQSLWFCQQSAGRNSHKDQRGRQYFIRRPETANRHCPYFFTEAGNSDFGWGHLSSGQYLWAFYTKRNRTAKKRKQHDHPIHCPQTYHPEKLRQYHCYGSWTGGTVRQIPGAHKPVSYTHLDVYKRQTSYGSNSFHAVRTGA